MAFRVKTLLCFSALAGCAQVACAEDLAAVYQQALDNSPQYKADLYTMKSSMVGQDIALGKLLPNIALSGSAGQVNVYTTNQDGNYKNYAAGINLTQVLFDYNLYESYQGGKKSALQASETYESQKQQFIVDVAQAYFAVLNAKEQVDFSQANLKVVKSTLEQSEQKLKVGMTTDVDVKVAQANYYNALATLKSDNNNLESAYYALYQYTGVENETLADLKKELHFSDPVPKDINEWVQKGQADNTALKAQIYAQQVAEKAVSAATGTLSPTVSLDASYNVTDNSGNAFAMGAQAVPAGNSRNGYIGLSFTWNILNGGSDYASKKQAAFDYQAAAFTTLEQQRSVKQLIQSDYYNVVSTVKQIEALKQSVAAAQSSYEQYQARYKVGSATITDVLNQLQKLYESASLLANAKYTYINNVIQLKFDAGVLSEKDIHIFNSWLKA